ncbi:hypothetical protein [Salinispora vitiensis]
MIIPYRKPADGNELPDWKQDLNRQHRTVHTWTDTASGIAHLHNVILAG